jgi:hypothetical protein
MLKKILLLVSTVRWLKLIQIRYQILYRIKRAQPLDKYNAEFKPEMLYLLDFALNPPVSQILVSESHFSILNLEVEFETSIDWNFQDNGKLWNYNLQYANYLLQEDVSVETKVSLIKSIYASLIDGRLLLEPYPVSLRAINIIRLLSSKNIRDEFILKGLHAEIDFLSHRLEYHLLGNHLLENAFALMAGGAFFSNTIWISKGQAILLEQLNEQILLDGAHFELSPMYHQIILFRLLELIDWYADFPQKDHDFETFIRNKASKMRSWLAQMTFNNGDIPHFNDSSIGIAYPSDWLENYADILSVASEQVPRLSDSGYRVFKNQSYECAVDVAQIGPSYQSGHGHSDALSFILYHKNQPVFVEQGTSTYQIGERRDLERSTSAHNTVVVREKSQSNVWGGFRVANRAIVDIIIDEDNYIYAKHNGYRTIGFEHSRKFIFSSSSVKIEDKVLGDVTEIKTAYFHLHPRVVVTFGDNFLSLEGIGTVILEGAVSVYAEPYNMAEGYNRYLTGQRLMVKFKDELITEIRFN